MTLPQRHRVTCSLPTLPAIVAIAALLLAAPGCTGGDPAEPKGGGAAPADPAPGDGTAGSVQIPSYWFESDFDSWVGQRWDQIDLFQFLDTAPTGIERGTRYVVFYSRTCEHCEDMFHQDLVPDPEFARQVTLVEVPAEKNRLTSPDAWDKPAVDSEELALPLGANWIITTPLSVRVVDGVIECAEEGEHKNCLGLDG